MFEKYCMDQSVTSFDNHKPWTRQSVPIDITDTYSNPPLPRTMLKSLINQNKNS